MSDLRTLMDKLELSQWIWDQLQVAVTRQSKMAAPYRTGGRSSEHPLFFDNRASDVAADFRNTLRRWATEVVCNCSVPWQACDNSVGTDPKEIAAWMIRHVVRFIDHPGVLDDISRAIDAALVAVDRPPSRLYLGDCRCGARVMGDPDDSVATCARCGAAHDAEALRAKNIARGGELLVTAREAARYIGELYGVRLTVKRIYAWHKQGRIENRSRTGDMLFRFGDIVALIRAPRSQLHTV
jgi:hypothetical protein